MSDKVANIIMYGTSLNSDDEDRVIKQGDGRNRLNITLKDGVLKTIKGNKLIPYKMPSGTNKCIGAIEDLETHSFFYFIWNSKEFHRILRYSVKYDKIDVIIENKGENTPTVSDFFNGLHFKQDMIITGGVANGILYWNDTMPRKINIIASWAFFSGKRIYNLDPVNLDYGVYIYEDDIYINTPIRIEPTPPEPIPPTYVIAQGDTADIVYVTDNNKNKVIL